MINAVKSARVRQTSSLQLRPSSKCFAKRASSIGVAIPHPRSTIQDVSELLNDFLIRLPNKIQNSGQFKRWGVVAGFGLSMTAVVAAVFVAPHACMLSAGVLFLGGIGVSFGGWLTERAAQKVRDQGLRAYIQKSAQPGTENTIEVLRKRPQNHELFYLACMVGGFRRLIAATEKPLRGLSVSSPLPDLCKRAEALWQGSRG